MLHSELYKSPSRCRREGVREVRDKERKSERKKRSSLRPRLFIKLMLGHKSPARRPRLGLISQASKTQPWEALEPKCGSHLSPFGVFYIQQHFIGARFGWDDTGRQKKRKERGREREGGRVIERSLWVYKCVCVCLFIDSWQRDKSSSWHSSRGVSSLHSPLPRERMWTFVTQVHWHTWKCTSPLLALSTCQPPSSPSPLLLSLPLPAPASSSILISLSLAVCAVIGRSFVIQQIPSSNLFMVVVDNKCDCSMIEPITMDPIEIMYILLFLPEAGERDWKRIVHRAME